MGFSRRTVLSGTSILGSRPSSDVKLLQLHWWGALQLSAMFLWCEVPVLPRHLCLVKGQGAHFGAGWEWHFCISTSQSHPNKKSKNHPTVRWELKWFVISDDLWFQMETFPMTFGFTLASVVRKRADVGLCSSGNFRFEGFQADGQAAADEKTVSEVWGWQFDAFCGSLFEYFHITLFSEARCIYVDSCWYFAWIFFGSFKMMKHSVKGQVCQKVGHSGHSQVWLWKSKRHKGWSHLFLKWSMGKGLKMWYPLAFIGYLYGSLHTSIVEGFNWYFCISSILFHVFGSQTREGTEHSDFLYWIGRKSDLLQ